MAAATGATITPPSGTTAAGAAPAGTEPRRTTPSAEYPHTQLDAIAARRSLIEALGDFARVSRATDAGESHGFSRLQVSLLIRLARHGATRLTDLAADLAADLSVVSRQAAHLADRGYIERLRDVHDRRAYQVSITPEGEEMVRQIRAGRDRWLACILDPWEGREIAQAATMVRTVVTSIQNAQAASGQT